MQLYRATYTTMTGTKWSEIYETIADTLHATTQALRMGGIKIEIKVIDGVSKYNK